MQVHNTGNSSHKLKTAFVGSSIYTEKAVF